MTTYNVKVSGSDGATGIGDANAWSTVGKVNGFSLSPGDSVLFNRGDTWRGTALVVPTSGTAGARITFGAYGTGNKPKFYGSTVPGSWTQEGALWYATQAVDPVQIWFVDDSDVTTWGLTKTLKASLAVEYDFWWDSPNSRLYVVAATNPATRYASVEFATASGGTQCIDLNQKDYITIDNLDLRYAINQGIKASPAIGTIRNGLTITNGKISYIGQRNVGGLATVAYGIICGYSQTLIDGMDITQCGRRGITGTVLAGVTEDGWELRNSNIHDCWHQLVDFFNDGAAGIIRNVNVHHNTFSMDQTRDITVPAAWTHGSLQWSSTIGSAATSNLQAHHNLFIGTADKHILCEGVSNFSIYNNTFWGPDDQQTAQGAHVNVTAACSGVNRIKNNIFYSTAVLAVAPTWPAIYTGGPASLITECDYNLYWMTDPTSKLFWDNTASSYTMAQFATYRSATGFDAHSPTPADPIFVAVGTDFTLQISSPAKDAGTVIPGITDGFVGTAPDIGRWEYQSGAPLAGAVVGGDLIRETTTTTGIGPLTLLGAVTDFRAFSAIPGMADQSLVEYTINHQTLEEFETGFGRWATGATLTRLVVYQSSNANTIVNFSAGTKDVFCTFPSMRGALPVTNRYPKASALVPPGMCAYVSGRYEIAAATSLELGVDATLEIG